MLYIRYMYSYAFDQKWLTFYQKWLTFRRFHTNWNARWSLTWCTLRVQSQLPLLITICAYPHKATRFDSLAVYPTLSATAYQLRYSHIYDALLFCVNLISFIPLFEVNMYHIFFFFFPLEPTYNQMPEICCLIPYSESQPQSLPHYFTILRKVLVDYTQGLN